MKKVLARCPGTCGEWVQGSYDGVPFLVDCPIDSFSEVVTMLEPSRNQWIVPNQKQKVINALKILLQDERLRGFGGSINFIQELPEGKGMASSTADITASLASILFSAGLEPSPAIIARIALMVEPSDSIMFPGITEMDHINGTYTRNLGKAVQASLLALDWGGVVDTLEFNASGNLSGHYRRFQKETTGALKLIREGIKEQDLEKVAYASTISARCNLEVNPKPLFEQFLTWVKENGGLGVVGAHSGTLLAGVFPIETKLDHLVFEGKETFTPDTVQVFKTINGGVRIENIDTAQEYSCEAV